MFKGENHIRIPKKKKKKKKKDKKLSFLLNGKMESGQCVHLFFVCLIGLFSIKKAWDYLNYLMSLENKGKKKKGGNCGEKQFHAFQASS